MKKILIIFIILALVALGAWFFLTRPGGPQIGVGPTGSPFGQEEGSSLTTGSINTPFTPGETGGISGDEVLARGNLIQVSSTPVSGAIALTQGGNTMIRYVDRATGHIYDFNPLTMARIKIANQTLPKIYEAHFRPDGNAVLLRSLKNSSDTVENLSLTLTPPPATSVSTSSPQATALYTTSSILLRGDISSVSVGSGNTIFYALKDTSSVVSSAFNGSGLRTILSSPFTNWRLAALGNTVILQTKASNNALGYAYTINTSGSLTKILGPLNSLIVTPNSVGNRVLYSYVEDNITKLFSKNLTTGATSEILPATLAEKCVWNSKNASTAICGGPISGVGGSEPDNWYRGVSSFSDRIWLFDTDSQVAELLSEPREDLGISLDVYQPKLSPSEDYFIFINKQDLSLWTLKLD